MHQIKYAMAIAACCAAIAQAAAQEIPMDGSQNGNPMLFKQDAQPFGKSMATWGSSPRSGCIRSRSIGARSSTRQA